MMKYRLVCGEGHELEGWFRTGGAYENQAARGQIACPHCGTIAVSKAIMAPNVATHAEPSADSDVAKDVEATKQVHALMRTLRAAVEENADYVGPRFAEEARKIHYEESAARGVYGEASAEEVEALCEEGIAILPLPRMREDLN